MSETTTGQHIHSAIVEAMKEIARIGIAKDKTAALGGASVNYRGIESAMNNMSGVLIRHGITVSPRYSGLSITERLKGDPKDAKATRFATLLGAFTFTSKQDGSSVVCECFGEAMDSGDKAVTKAQSVAFRTALFQLFVVPTMAIDPEADPDSDGGTESLAHDATDHHFKAIDSAPDMPSLRKAREAALQAAQQAGDLTAYEDFKKAAAARKAILGPAASS